MYILLCGYPPFYRYHTALLPTRRCSSFSPFLLFWRAVRDGKRENALALTHSFLLHAIIHTAHDTPPAARTTTTTSCSTRRLRATTNSTRTHGAPSPRYPIKPTLACILVRSPFACSFVCPFVSPLICPYSCQNNRTFVRWIHTLNTTHKHPPSQRMVHGLLHRPLTPTGREGLDPPHALRGPQGALDVRAGLGAPVDVWQCAQRAAAGHPQGAQALQRKAPLEGIVLSLFFSLFFLLFLSFHFSSFPFPFPFFLLSLSFFLLSFPFPSLFLLFLCLFTCTSPWTEHRLLSTRRLPSTA